MFSLLFLHFASTHTPDSFIVPMLIAFALIEFVGEWMAIMMLLIKKYL